MKKTVSLFLFLFCAGFLPGEIPAELTLHPVDPVEGPAPAVDGKDDDSAWKTASVFRNYHVFNEAAGNPGKLRTELRMLYDERGIYLLIENFEEHPENLRRKITDFDNPDLWTDDCAELYFDAKANGISYHCFKVNSLGARADFRRMDAAVYQNGWSGCGWSVGTRVEKDRWIIEAFFPWEDLPAKAKAGDLWMFCHTRFAFTTGKFVGVTSSVLGGYSNPRRFGYAYFRKPGEKISGGKIASELERSAEEPWMLPSEDSLILRENGKTSIRNYGSAVADLRSDTEKTASELDSSNPEVRKLNVEEKSILSSSTFESWKQWYVLREKYKKLKWKIALEEDLN